MENKINRKSLLQLCQQWELEIKRCRSSNLKKNNPFYKSWGIRATGIEDCVGDLKRILQQGEE